PPPENPVPANSKPLAPTYLKLPHVDCRVRALDSWKVSDTEAPTLLVVFPWDVEPVRPVAPSGSPATHPSAPRAVPSTDSDTERQIPPVFGWLRCLVHLHLSRAPERRL